MPSPLEDVGDRVTEHGVPAVTNGERSRGICADEFDLGFLSGSQVLSPERVALFQYVVYE